MAFNLLCRCQSIGWRLNTSVNIRFLIIDCMLSKILMIPFFIAAAIFAYITMQVDSSYSYYIVPNVVIIAGLYIMSPQIDWWWYQRRPPKLPEGLVKMLMARMPFFQQLSQEDKTKFCHRMALYMEANEFIPKGMEEMPYDIKAVVAATVVQLTLYREDFLLNKFEHIIVYPHPFPSPQYREWHACEIFEEDGVIMFSAEQLMAGFAQGDQYFNVGLYEYAKVFMRCHPEVSMPMLPADVWTQLQAVSRFPKEAVEKWIGLKELNVMAVAISHYFVFRDRFNIVMPGVFQSFEKLFGKKTPLH